MSIQYVCHRPRGLHSRAMNRMSAAISRGLEQYNGQRVGLTLAETSRPVDADIEVLYVISYADTADYVLRHPNKHFVLVQCCHRTAGGTAEDWDWLWSRPNVSVVSYLDLGHPHALVPLGADDVFADPVVLTERKDWVITTGYVAGNGAEAIHEVWDAARIVGMRAIHIGPDNLARPNDQVKFYKDISDSRLVDLYSNAKFVSGLRHIEGFELPAAEGACCGAVALVFPQYSTWYRPTFSAYVPDVSGEDLVRALVGVMSAYDWDPHNVARQARRAFSWQPFVSAVVDRIQYHIEQMREGDSN